MPFEGLFMFSIDNIFQTYVQCCIVPIAREVYVLRGVVGGEDEVVVGI